MIGATNILDIGIVSTGELSACQRARMCALMVSHFEGMDRDCFDRDLTEKPWTILLTDVSGMIRGFSTLDIMEARVNGHEVKAVYSGDTIIDLRHRTTSALPRAFLRFLARHTGAWRDNAEWFWFYVCKGFRTYRFLPVFYHNFLPHPGRAATVFEQKVLDQLAGLRFGDAYDPATGVVRVPGDYILREGVGDVTEERSCDRFIRYFAERNPGWRRGEELACLVSLAKTNFRPKSRQWLEKELMA